MTVFERNDYIGGRTNVKRLAGYEDEPPVELGASDASVASRLTCKGASIFVPVRGEGLNAGLATIFRTGCSSLPNCRARCAALDHRPDACGREGLAPDRWHETVALTLAQANLHLWHAVTAFNLTLQSGHGGAIEDNGGLGIFDGETFVYEEAKGGWSWWSMAKVSALAPR